MTIKYAEITIIRNLEQETIFRAMSRYIGYENITNDNDTIIIIFDDDTICDTKDEYIDKKYKFSILYHDYNFPIYFELNKEITLFYRRPSEENNKKKLNFKPIFRPYYKYNNVIIEASEYNLIYEDIFKKEILAIVRIKSNEEKPRFLLAYDDKLLDRTSIIYLIDCIFKHKFN